MARELTYAELNHRSACSRRTDNELIHTLRGLQCNIRDLFSAVLDMKRLL